MPRQVDDAGSRVLVEKIEALGVQVHLNKATKEVLGDGRRRRAGASPTASALDVEMVIVSAGIRPRDELARECGLAVGERGGVVVDDELRTSDPDIFAIGEVALHRGMIYGLVAPGYEMAEIVAANLAGERPHVRRRRPVDQAQADGRRRRQLRRLRAPTPKRRAPLVFEDPFRGVYKKLLFSPDGTRLLGGILVGDAADYGTLLALCQERRAAAAARPAS